MNFSTTANTATTYPVLLINGPRDHDVVEDDGESKVVKVPIKKKWLGLTIEGFAIYEPTELRDIAFFSHNVWEEDVNSLDSPEED